MRGLLLAAIVLGLIAADVSHGARAQCPILRKLEGELICPTCRTTLDQSRAPVADRMREFICERDAAGASEDEIKRDLEAQFGKGVLAAPPARGFDLLAWVLPIGGVLLAAAVIGLLAWRWSRAREPSPVPGGPASDGRPPLDPELERRVDAELARFGE